MTLRGSLQDYVQAIAEVLVGKRGTQVNKSGSLKATGQTTLYTVTSGKTLRLSNVWLSIAVNSAVGDAILYVQNGSDVFQFALLHICGKEVNNATGMSRALISPIEIPAGYDIVLSTNADQPVQGGFSGWEEPEV